MDKKEKYKKVQGERDLGNPGDLGIVGGGRVNRETENDGPTHAPTR